ncbi:MAG: metallophosphoesterase [Bacteroidetes bacterium]|nr:metallophosphoesterase [Bacteroidota bacterium]
MRAATITHSTLRFALSVLVAAVFVLSAFHTQAQQDSVTFQMVLVGDAGMDDFPGRLDSVMKAMPRYNAPSAIMYLGDNVYPHGMPGPEGHERKESERILLNQVKLGDGFDKMFFIPGNHDWKNGRREGLDYVLEQQKFLDSLKRGNLYFPLRDGCPGPEEIHLSRDVVLVALNTQWFLHPWERPEGEKSHCEAKNSGDVVVQFEDILERNQGKRIIVMGHHPVYTYGPHGGVFTWKDHLFPLTAANPHWWLPLPIVGSLMPLYRQVFGDIQDGAHPRNKAFRRSLEEVLGNYPGTVYASGHEHALEYVTKDSITYVVSGSGSKSSAVKKKGFAQFVSAEKGYVRILLSGTSAKVEYYSANGKLAEMELPELKPLKPVVFEYKKSDTLWVEAHASNRYETTSFRKIFLGENYRKEWRSNIQLQAFDIGREHGGLKILKRGGGMETMTLRLEDSLKREYSLRSVEKYPAKAMRPNLRKTLLQGVVQDQISAEHPYGALAAAPLAQSAGIYHTNPKLVYAPYDVRWGSYKKDFAGQMMIFEERPDGSGKSMPYFGNPDRMISTHRLLEHMDKDNDNRVDQHLVLKARLFDMLIGDWDRHDDQWRWGEFDEKKTKVFKPIPRDRDQAFFIRDGLVPSKMAKKRFHPYLEGFDYKIYWAPGLMQVGRWFDRTFLNEMNRADFEQAAKELVSSLTDASIDSAVRHLPAGIFQLHGQDIIDKLKARRNILTHHALIYYDFLSDIVTVRGSNKREWFEGQWTESGKLNLTVFKRDKDGHRGKQLYYREFIPGETKEVRLFGLGGDDYFHFTGASGKSFKVRVIGGPGSDLLENLETGRSRLFVYDDKGGIQMTGKGIRDKTSTDPKVNEYDRKDFEYNKISPKHTVTYNIDDGVFIGTGFSTIAHGFRKKPYQSHHMLQGSYAIRTSSFNIRYEGRFPSLFGKYDLEVDADMKSPNYVNNFFGWGNESVFDQHINEQPGLNGVPTAIDYYRLRFKETHIEVKLRRRIGQWGYIKGGPIVQRGEIVDPSQDRFIKEYNATLPSSILAIPKDFGGFTFNAGLDKRDHQTYTTRGIVVKFAGRYMKEFGGPGFTTHNASFTLYQSFRLPAKVTFVFNAGAGHNTGTYQLYQAQTLDGKTEIRGFRKTRFYGDTKVYFNNELRLRLGNVHTYLFPAEFGLHAFYDVGRVWYKDMNGIDPSAATGVSNVWHNSFGGGLWFIPYDLTTIVTEIGQSNEGTLFYLRLGFLF